MFQDAKGLDKIEIDADICIIGAGAAGITLALEFINSSKRVIVLESGGTKYESKTQSLHKGVISGLPYEPLNLCRVRGFGGSTSSPRGWGGWCKPLASMDFEQRPWVSMSGWPISREDLNPYYERACETLQLPSTVFSSNFSNTINDSLLSLTGTACYNEISILSTSHDLGRSSRTRLQAAKNVVVITHANVKEIETDEDAKNIIGVRIITLGGKTLRVAASYFVLAAGGIENPRLLLTSNRIMKNGLGNASDYVGRCFQENPRFSWGKLSGSKLAPLLLRYSPGWVAKQRQDHYIGVSTSALIGAGLVINPEIQRKEMILNARSWIVPTPEKGESESGRDLQEFVFWLKKHRLPSDALRRLRSIASDIPGIIRTISAYYKGKIGKAKHWQFVTVMEQEPNTMSRVTIDSSRDQLGMPRVRLDWRFNGLEHNTLEKNQQIIVTNLSRLGLQCSFDKHMTETFEEAPRWAWHHIGTTRMSTNPKQGVVDADCRIHGINNLYVVGSSVFPTSGNDMPTLTIVALSHRLAVHLKAMLEKTPVVAAMR
jgi:choline dehydrogenase-like flavoprotein